MSSVITSLKTEFSVGSEAELPFRYLGLDLARGENRSLIVDRVTMCQQSKKSTYLGLKLPKKLHICKKYWENYSGEVS